MSEQAQPGPSEAIARRSRTERVLEAVLMLFCAVFFLFMLEESTKWSAGVALLPRIASAFGLVVRVVYAIQRFRPHRGGGQIMDMGFDEEGLERSVVIERTLRFVGTTAAFFVGIWLIGFHLAVPLYMMLYLIIFGKLRWWIAALSALGFLVFMIVAYDIVIRDTWPEPLIRLPLPGVRY
jgi:tripartite tricarboxylate transporter TctB family protein